MRNEEREASDARRRTTSSIATKNAEITKTP
jgi:hypothetical protein